MEITKLNQMFDVLKSRPKKRLVAAFAMDDHTVCAVNDAVDNGLIDATLIGDEARIAEICKAEGNTSHSNQTAIASYSSIQW